MAVNCLLLTLHLALVVRLPNFLAYIFPMHFPSFTGRHYALLLSLFPPPTRLGIPLLRCSSRSEAPPNRHASSRLDTRVPRTI